MLLFGHRFIDSERFYHIDTIDAIAHTPSNSTLFISFSEANLDILTHCQDNQLHFALEVQNITQLVYAENLGARFIVVEETLATTAQKIAETYLFDAKVLTRITQEAQIEEAALSGIDGVIFPEAIIKITA